MHNKKKTGLFFGSFNPIHVGHLIIANHVLTHSDLNEVWLVVTPHNPLKKKETLASDYDRLMMVDLAIAENDRIKSSNIEFFLPKPSYTIDTLTFLEEKHPEKSFHLIMGGDNLVSLPQWKNYELLINKYPIIVYQRSSYEVSDLADHANIMLLDAPRLDISSSYIRKCISEEKSVRYMVTDAVHKYMEEKMLYIPRKAR
jgi:nicotinate-nucleotide adenylyltransferase